MPAPTTRDAFLDCVRKSGLVESARLDAVLLSLREKGEARDEPRQLAAALTEAGLLTHFQTEQLLRGKHRNFILCEKYKLLERLGKGGMGTVFLCEHVRMRRLVAVKVLPADKAADPGAVERFYREARAVAALDHPNIVRAYDIDEEGKVHFLVMEYVDGVNLYDLVKGRGPLSPARAAHYVAQAAEGLQHAHEAGLVHRDVKPSNLLLDRGGTVKVLDLGLARFFRDGDDDLTRKHASNAILGTADYLAPEQALDAAAADIRSDIYALGVTFYFLLAGGGPFKDGSVAEKIVWHHLRRPEPIRDLRPEVPEGMARVLERMMAKDPAQRYQTPAEVVAALAAWTAEPIDPPAAEELPPVCPAVARAQEESGWRSPPGGGSSHVRRGRPAPAAAGAAPAESPPARPKKRRRPAVPLLLVAAVVIVVAAAGGAALRLAGAPSRAAATGTPRDDTPAPAEPADTGQGKPADTGPAPPDKPKPPLPAGLPAGSLAVTRSGAEGSFPTVAAALAQAGPGARVLLLDEDHEEQLTLSGFSEPDVTVAPWPAAKTVTWRPPVGQKRDQPLLALSGVQRLRLKDIRLDGEGRVDRLVHLSGRCTGLALEGVEARGFNAAAVTFRGCAGLAQDPVTLARVRVAAGHADAVGVSFAGGADQGSAHVRLLDGRIEGPLRAAVLIDAPVTDLEVRGNRVFRAADGVLYRKAGPPHPLQMTLDNNTFCELGTGLRFQTLPTTAEKSRVTVRDNLFLKTPKISHVDDLRLEPAAVAAGWIWFDEGNPLVSAPAEARYFRKTFELPKGPWKKATLDVACDDSALAWVNDKSLGKNRDRAWSRRVHAFDVSKLLRPGKNVLAVDGVNNLSNSGRGGGAAGLLVRLTCVPEKGEPVVVVSDATWKVSKEAPDDWRRLDFDDGAWPAAKALASYDKAPAGWKNLIWDSEIQAQYPGEAKPIALTATTNAHDRPSKPAYPLAWGRQMDVTLPTDPADGRTFLRYPKEHGLAKFGTNGAPVGAPPVD